MPLLEVCCQNTVSLVAEYDRELHAFTRILERPNERFAPIGARDGSGSIGKGGLTSWWRSRAIPSTRDGFERLRSDLDGVHPLDLLESSLGLSLSDQFWIREVGSGLLWEDVNFFDNGFDGQLGLFTLGSSGVAAAGLAGKTARDPNSSLGGNLKKAWEQSGDGFVLVKAGSKPFEQEPANELIATRLFERLLDPGDFVPYSVEMRDGHPYSVCPDMIGRDECFVPAWDIINASKRPGHLSPWLHLLGCYDALGIERAERQLSKMFACDYIVANQDRHWNNFGIVFDARTMEADRVVPIFDTGGSLFFKAPELDAPVDFWYRPIPLIEQRAKRVSPEDQLALIKDLEWFDASALDGFDNEVREILRACTRHPQKRIDAIVGKIRENIETVRRWAE